MQHIFNTRCFLLVQNKNQYSIPVKSSIFNQQVVGVNFKIRGDKQSTFQDLANINKDHRVDHNFSHTKLKGRGYYVHKSIHVGGMPGNRYSQARAKACLLGGAGRCRRNVIWVRPRPWASNPSSPLSGWPFFFSLFTD